MSHNFIIGDKEYPATIKFKVRRYILGSNKDNKISKDISIDQVWGRVLLQQDTILEATLMCLNDKPFKNKEALIDILSDDEFTALDKFFAELLFPKVEAKSEIEKKSDAT